MAFTKSEIVELYVATFNRAPDAAGLNYWMGVGTPATTATTVIEVANAMIASPEMAAKYPSTQTTEQFIEAMYQNLFGRAADAAGLAYWKDKIDGTNTAGNNATNETIPKANMIKALIDGAKASTGSTTDAAVLANKTAVGTAFADAGLNDVAQATSIMSGVTSDAATKDAAIATLTTQELTTGSTDILTGTTGTDTFTGTSTTIQAGDLIIDSTSTDNDTFNMSLTAANGAMRVSGVENINVDWDAFGTAAIDATNITGATITGTSSKTGFQGSMTVTASGNNTIVAGTGMDGTLTANGVTTGTITGGTATGIVVTSDTDATTDDTVTVTAGTATTSVDVQGFKEMTVDAGTATTIQLDDNAGGSDDENTASLTFGADATLTNNVDDLTVTAAAADLTLTVDAVDASLDVAGTNNMTLAVATMANLTGEKVTKSSTGTVTVTATGASGAADLSDVTADLFVYKSTITGAQTLAATGQTVTLEADANAGTFTTGTGTTDTLALNISTDQTALTTTTTETTTINVLSSTTAVADAPDLTITLINAGTNKAVLTGANDITVTEVTAATVDATAMTADLTITQTAGETAVAQDISGGTAKNTVVFITESANNNYVGQNGDDTVTFATIGGTAVGVLGDGTNSVTANALTSGNITIVGGTGADTVSATAAITGNAVFELGDGKNEVTLGAGAAAGNITIITGTGDDTVTLGTTNATQTLNMTLGEGTDTLELAGSVNISAGTQTITGLDAIKMAGGAGNTVAASLVSGNTIAVSATANAADILTIVATKSTGETIDVSTLNMSQNISTAVVSTVITGLAGDDTITGTSIADAINGAAGKDTIIFADSGANNGIDTFGTNFVVTDDTMNFKNFLSGGTFNSSVIEHDATGDVDITNKVSLLASTDAGVAEVDTATEVAALIEGSGDAMSLTSGGKAILIAGDNSIATAGATIWYVDDSLGATAGTVEADDVVAVGILEIDIDTITSSNIAFA